MRAAAPAPDGAALSLVIAIPTIPRHGKNDENVDYLTGTIESLVREATSSSAKSRTPLFSSVEIM